ncbi:MAG TPA: prepilin-type N-terminal cleavage/methylation domain-containing protein [Humisphaera sp.]
MRSRRIRSVPAPRRGGFTLVELLVVIGIIALLMGILLPTLGRVREKGKTTLCLNNIRQLGQAAQAYSADGVNYYPPAYWGWSQATPPWNPGNPPPGYDTTVPPRRYWIHNANFKLALGVKDGYPENGRYPMGLMCPNAPLSEERSNRDGGTLHNSYGMNYTSLPALAATMYPVYWQAWRKNQVLVPSERVLFCDATSEGVSVGSQTTGKPNSTMTYFDPYYGGERHEGPDWGGAVAYRHTKGANLLFFDGHAQWLPMNEIQYDPTKPETADKQKRWLTNKR